MTNEEIYGMVDFCKKINMVCIGLPTTSGSANFYFPMNYLDEYIEVMKKGGSLDLVKFIISTILKEKDFFTFKIETYSNNNRMYVATPNGKLMVGYEPYLLYSNRLLTENSEFIRDLDNEFFYAYREKGLEVARESLSSYEILKKLYDGLEITMIEKDIVVKVNLIGDRIEVTYDGEEMLGTHIVGVRFMGSTSGCYYYLGDNSLYNIGDIVEVNTRNNGRQRAKVVFRKVYKDDEPLPYDKNELSTVIGKVE